MCLIEADAAVAHDGQIDVLAQHLLDAGAVMVCCHGEGCERVGARFEVVIKARAGSDASLEIAVRPLSGSVQEAVAFMLDGACLAPCYPARCGAVLMLVMDSGIYRLGMIEMAIAIHLLQGPEPPQGPAAVRSG